MLIFSLYIAFIIACLYANSINRIKMHTHIPFMHSIARIVFSGLLLFITLNLPLKHSILVMIFFCMSLWLLLNKIKVYLL